jgi:hypothetical protein
LLLRLGIHGIILCQATKVGFIYPLIIKYLATRRVGAANSGEEDHSGGKSDAHNLLVIERDMPN